VCGLGLRPALAAPADDAPPATLAVQVLAADGLSEAERRLINDAAVAAARDAGRWQLPKGDPTGAAGVSARADKALGRSDKSLDEAKERIKNLEDGALDLLDWAADEYARYLPDLIARDGNPRRLVEVYAQQTIQHFLDGETEEATAALRHCFVLEPELDYDKKVFPPQLEQFVMQGRLLFDELGVGSLEVVGAGGVNVWVNGVPHGTTPVKLGQLRAGPNFVTLAVVGVDPVTVTVDIDGGHKATVDAGKALAPSKPSGPLARAGGEIGKPTAGPKLRAAAAELGVDALLILVPKVAGAELALTATIYDLRGGVRAGQGETTQPRPKAAAGVGELVERMLGKARWRTAAPVAPAGPGFWDQMGDRWDGARKSKYFWPAVGITAGVLVIGIAVAATSGLSNAEKVTLFPVVTF
jgi:hypothetical protein